MGKALTETDPNQYVTTCQYDCLSLLTQVLYKTTSGAVGKSVEYDSFGDLKSQTNAAVEHLFAYTGRFLDELTGDQNHLHRWYDPDIAQWLSEDPIGFAGGAANLKRYVGNSPANGTDSTGLYVDGGFAGSFHVYSGRSLDSKDFLGTVSYDPNGGPAHRVAARKLAEELEQIGQWFGDISVLPGITASDAEAGAAAAEVAAWLKKHPDAVYGPPLVESSIAVYGRGSSDRCRIHSITLSRPFGAAITESMAAAMFGFSSRPGGGLDPESEDEYSPPASRSRTPGIDHINGPRSQPTNVGEAQFRSQQRAGIGGAIASGGQSGMAGLNEALNGLGSVVFHYTCYRGTYYC